MFENKSGMTVKYDWAELKLPTDLETGDLFWDGEFM